MATNKTVFTDEDVESFISSFVVSEEKRSDSFKLIELMMQTTGFKPKMWGPSIIGFGSYNYKYESGHKGTAPLVGFSPRKSAISLYVFTGMDDHEYLLEGLGKFTKGKACIYIKRLSDIDVNVLVNLIKTTVDYLQFKYK